MKHLAFDLETCSADDLFRRPDFVRLGAYGTSKWHRMFTDGGEIVEGLHLGIKDGRVLVGHNICDFDLVALARWHGLKLADLRGKIVDTYLLALINDPPLSGIEGRSLMPRGYYTLDQTCAHYGMPGKTDSAKRLAKAHGGFDMIPVDDPEYRSYLAGDIDASSRLINVMPMNDYAKREMEVGLITSQMRLNGFRVDVPELERALEQQKIRKQEHIDQLSDLTGMPTGRTVGIRNPRWEEFSSPLATDLGKAAIIEFMLANGIKEKAIPLTPKTGKLSTGADDMRELYAKIVKHGGNAKLEIMIELIISIVGERTVYQTINETRIDDRVHPSIAPSQASGRWSITRPGLTVLGKHGGRHVERRVLLPEIGHSNMTVDLAQVDARAVAAHSQDRNYMAIFQNGLDLHTTNAITAFGDASKREHAKPIGHGWNYGMSVGGLVKQGVTREIAEQFNAAMRENHPDVVRWQNNVRQMVRAGNLLDNGWGRMMRADPRYAHTQAPALVGQGCTRDILAEGMLRLPVEVRPMLRSIIHDELVLSVPTDQFEDVARVVKAALTFDFRDVPIECDVSKPARTWADAYEKG